MIRAVWIWKHVNENRLHLVIVFGEMLFGYIALLACVCQS